MVTRSVDAGYLASFAAGRTGLAQDAQFHGAICTAAHNRAITRIAHGLIDVLTQSREESLNTPGRPTRSHEDHRRVLQAIAARQPEAAERAMLDHLDAVEALVLGMPKAPDTSPRSG